MPLIALDDLLDLRVQIGDLLVGGIWRDDVDELVLSGRAHESPSGLSGPACRSPARTELTVEQGEDRGLVRRLLFRLNLFITAAMPSLTNSLGGIRRAADRLGNDRRSSRLELRQHVIREIAAGVSTPDADPQPCELFRPQLLDERLETVVPARRSAGPAPAAVPAPG